jgi:hypothetical protein
LEEYQPSNSVDVTFEGLKQLAGLGIPDLDSAILPTRSDPAAVWAEGQRDRSVAATYERHFVVADDIMDGSRVIVARNGQAGTIRTEGNQVRSMIIALSCELTYGVLRFVQTCSVPKLHHVIVTDGRQVPAVWTERQFCNLVSMLSNHATFCPVAPFHTFILRSPPPPTNHRPSRLKATENSK